MPVADERGRARSVSHLTPGQMPVSALPLMVCGVAVCPSRFWLRCSGVVALRVNVREWRRSAGRYERYNEEHTRGALKHRSYFEEGRSHLSIHGGDDDPRSCGR